MNALAVLITEAIAEHPMREVARRCGLSQWRLYKIAQGRSKRPEPETLRAIERGLGIPYAKLALAAYGANGESTSPQEDSVPRPHEQPASAPSQSG